MLTEHASKTAKQLSGGMRRKLSLAMALVGHSRLLILDEPTSGLDLDSRQKIWQLIHYLKRTRTIVISTQHIEEADELSDLVCIMSTGKVLVLDSATNIKERFGVGYHLIVEGESLPKVDDLVTRFDWFKPVIIETQTSIKRGY
jgi:ATP-binding cassette, subfamily A (ABC1), member 3